jgi:general secretion pathway protein G
MYRLDNYRYPSSEQSLTALVEKTTLSPLPRKWPDDAYLESLPVDPWGRPYLDLSPGEEKQYEIYTLGADGVRGGEGQNQDYLNWTTPNDS